MLAPRAGGRGIPERNDFTLWVNRPQFLHVIYDGYRCVILQGYARAISSVAEIFENASKTRADARRKIFNCRRGLRKISRHFPMQIEMPCVSGKEGRHLLMTCATSASEKLQSEAEAFSMCCADQFLEGYRISMPAKTFACVQFKSTELAIVLQTSLTEASLLFRIGSRRTRDNAIILLARRNRGR